MRNRRNPFLPTAEGVERRLLLSTAHHPAAADTGTIHGELKEVPPSHGGFVVATYAMVKTSGTLTPYGKVTVEDGEALDHSLTDDAPPGEMDHPVPNQQTLNFAVFGHGKGEATVGLSGPIVAPGTPLRAGKYNATILPGYPDGSGFLTTRTAILALPKGLPHNSSQLVPFTITLES